MADNTLKTRLLSAYNTLDFWSTCTTIPLGGEVCYAVDDNNKILEIKIGDGVHKYSELPAQSFDSADHLYKLSTPVSATADASNFTATTYLQSDDGQGGTFGNSSSAVLTIPSATTTKAGVESATDKKIIDAAADTRLTGGTTGSTAADNAYVTVNTKTVSSAGATSTGTSNLKVNGLGSMAFKSSADFVSNVSTAAYNISGVTIKQTKNGSASPVANFGSAVKSNITTAISLSSAPSSSSTDLPTDYAVWKAIDDLPEPMIFKGSVGTASATTSSLPTPSASNEGWTYKAITTGTSAVYHDLDGGETAANVKVGDTLISNGSKWIRVPSGDEPSGTVTSITIKANSPITIDSSAAITTSGTRTISHAAGNSSTTKVGSTTNVSGLGATINVPYLQADKYGHITTAGEYTLTNVTSAEVAGVKVNNAANADYATSAGDSAKLNGVAASNYLEAGDIVEGTGINVTTAAGVATVSADLATTTKYNSAAATVTAAQSTAVANRVYAVQPDKNGDLAVYIPWTDNNTNYYTTVINQTTAVDGFSATVAGNSSAVKGNFSIPAASTNSAGVMTTAQVDTLSKVKSATTAAEGLTKKPSGTAPISVDANNVVSHDNSGVTAGTYGDSTHIPKVTINAKGHVTSATTVEIPSATSAAEGLTKKPTGTAPISVSADNVISHDNSGVTAGVYGAAQTASFNGNVAIPSVKIDAKGHVTTAGTVNVKIPSTAGLGTSAKDVKTVLFKANTSGSNNDLGVVLTFNDNTTASSIITSTLILDGNFTS